MLAVAKAMARHREDAEDIAQEALLRFFRSLDRIDPTRPIEGWLVQITLNVARSFRSRRPMRREEELEPHGEQLVGPSGSSPETGLRRAELRAALRQALETTSVREREAFILRDLQGLETAVVAIALSVAEVTVRRLSTDARAKVLAWFRRERPDLLAALGVAPGTDR